MCDAHKIPARSYFMSGNMSAHVNLRILDDVTKGKEPGKVRIVLE